MWMVEHVYELGCGKGVWCQLGYLIFTVAPWVMSILVYSQTDLCPFLMSWFCSDTCLQTRFTLTLPAAPRHSHPKPQSCFISHTFWVYLMMALLISPLLPYFMVILPWKCLLSKWKMMVQVVGRIKVWLPLKKYENHCKIWEWCPCGAPDEGVSDAEVHHSNNYKRGN